MHCGHNQSKCDLRITALSILLLESLEQTVYIDNIEMRTMVESGSAVSILRCDEKDTVRDQFRVTA